MTASAAGELGTLVEELSPRGGELGERGGHLRAENGGPMAVLDASRTP
jgi:hypothetical protein